MKRGEIRGGGEKEEEEEEVAQAGPGNRAGSSPTEATGKSRLASQWSVDSIPANHPTSPTLN